MKRDRLTAWIKEMKTSGHWITHCPSCGCFFAQLHVGRMGRRATICERRRCIVWHRWQKKYGRAPPDWLMAKWKEVHGDAPRAAHEAKRYAEPRFEAA